VLHVHWKIVNKEV